MKPWILATLAAAAYAMLKSGGASATIEKLAYAISKAEGFGVPGAIPTLRNNPGNIRARSGEIATYSTPEDGWAALYRQINAMLTDTSGLYPPDATLADVARTYTGESAYLDWARNVSYYLGGVSIDTPFRELV